MSDIVFFSFCKAFYKLTTPEHVFCYYYNAIKYVLNQVIQRLKQKGVSGKYTFFHCWLCIKLKIENIYFWPGLNQMVNDWLPRDTHPPTAGRT